jgi:hypothetical protein
MKQKGGIMRETVARCVLAMGVGLAVMGAGCKKQVAPASTQPVVPSAPRVQPDFPVGSLPVENVDIGGPKVDRAPRRRQQVQPVQAPPSTDVQAAAAAEQRRWDATLLQQQQAASQRQQQELNRDIEVNLKTQQEMQAEPRIQDNPGTTPPQPTQPQ